MTKVALKSLGFWMPTILVLLVGLSLNVVSWSSTEDDAGQKVFFYGCPEPWGCRTVERIGPESFEWHFGEMALGVVWWLTLALIVTGVSFILRMRQSRKCPNAAGQQTPVGGTGDSQCPR